MANNPRHGDEIIIKKRGRLGDDRLIASRQFQEFLDDLANDSSEITDVSDLVQIIATISDQNQQLFSELIQTNKIVSANSQQLAILQSEVHNLQSNVILLSRTINNVEQLANVN